ncbi:MAG: DUF3306 domain-containing protein [Sulfitobacter sp.]
MRREGDFWARRRAGVAAEEKADRDAVEARTLAQDHAELEALSEAEILAKLDLPDPDSLVQGDDFSVFMAKAVPDRIRRRALRTLWRSNPVLANVDMLVDYGEDFTDATMAVENIQTAYQVGKGMLKHVQEVARQAEERETPSPAEHPRPAAESVPDSDPENETPLDQDPILATSEEVPDPAPDQSADVAPTPRRMKFKIEEHA